MGGQAPLCRALLLLALLPLAARGLRTIRRGQEEDCSQEGIQCSVHNSFCLDSSWFLPPEWTPSAPSHLAVSVVIGKNELNETVPILQINWTIPTDSSILQLKAVEISVVNANARSCMELRFSNTFPSPRNSKGEPWHFSYNGFEVTPGTQYSVTVQHLPRLKEGNYREQSLYVPGCSEGNMMLTDTCCKHGLCWFPNIAISNSGSNLTVSFNSRRDASKYGVQVKLNALQKQPVDFVYIQQGPPIQRLTVTFPGFADDIPHCEYNISVWPYMPPCNSDCIRQYYEPVCTTEPPTPPEPIARWYLWSLAAVLTLLLFGGIVLVLCLRDRVCHPGKPLQISTPTITPPTKQKVWLVYSADHKRYVDAVVKLADFLHQAWGMDVVLDRFHVQKIGMIGPMAWLSHQKSEIERTNGTILILCSKGAQEKWKAQRNGQQQRVTLKEDREHLLGDLFTPALTLILPDFQERRLCQQYAVAYFGHIASLEHIPDPLKICPKYSLTDNLQDLFFHIQKQERRQPNLELKVQHEEHLSYRHMVKVMDTCRSWQEVNVDWFEQECSSMLTPDLEDTTEVEDINENCSRRVYPVIVCPEESICMVTPLILEPSPAVVLDPTIEAGHSSIHVEPLLSDSSPEMSILQPLLHESTHTSVCIQEPCLVGEDPALKELSQSLLSQDFPLQSDQSDLSLQQVREAQKMLFQQSILPYEDMENYDVEIVNALDGAEEIGLDLNIRQPDLVNKPLEEVFLDRQLVSPEMDPFAVLPSKHSPQLPDQGYSTWNPHEMDLREIQKESLKFLLQNGDLPNFEQV
ncbi:interleukin-17 receptor A [Hyperolius riggenbachi]|uniref:interleukin-17 receptor A n=1 Tax=Hyperolius riggenbachi TaxID=752182 RepID=UPI0035A31028